VDIKIVIPALLLFLLDRALTAESAQPYGGKDYGRTPVMWLGVGWLVGRLAVGLIIDLVFRQRGRQLDLQRPIAGEEGRENRVGQD